MNENENENEKSYFKQLDKIVFLLSNTDKRRLKGLNPEQKNEMIKEVYHNIDKTLNEIKQDFKIVLTTKFLRDYLKEKGYKERTRNNLIHHLRQNSKTEKRSYTREFKYISLNPYLRTIEYKPRKEEVLTFG